MDEDAAVQPDRARTVQRYVSGRWANVPDSLAVEEPLEIRVRGRALSVTMRTPGHDEELAAGFLLTEGVVQSREDLLRVTPCERNEFGNVVNVLLAPDVTVDFQRLTRHVFASSSCGLCGKATIDAVCKPVERVTESSSPISVEPGFILDLPRRLRERQAEFDRTGGLHAAALFEIDSRRLLVCREDVGRHNAVDKVVGRALMDGIFPLNRHALLVSGRASFEIMQKSAAAGIPIVAAVSAPSSLAVDFAVASGQTLVGFLREGRMNVYANPERIQTDGRWEGSRAEIAPAGSVAL